MTIRFGTLSIFIVGSRKFEDLSYNDGDRHKRAYILQIVDAKITRQEGPATDFVEGVDVASGAT